MAFAYVPFGLLLRTGHICGINHDIAKSALRHSKKMLSKMHSKFVTPLILTKGRGYWSSHLEKGPPLTRTRVLPKHVEIESDY